MPKNTRTKTENAAPLPGPSLPQLCSEAADHMARARIALHDETLDADQALIHLDEAISCLKRLWTHGSTPNGGTKQGVQGPRLRSA
jgi:hypothetical protein